MENFAVLKSCCTFAPGNKKEGALAQLVEHRTENPCVPCSIQGGTTNLRIQLRPTSQDVGFFFLQIPVNAILSLTLHPNIFRKLKNDRR